MTGGVKSLTTGASSISPLSESIAPAPTRTAIIYTNSAFNDARELLILLFNDGFCVFSWSSSNSVILSSMKIFLSFSSSMDIESIACLCSIVKSYSACINAEDETNTTDKSVK